MITLSAPSTPPPSTLAAESALVARAVRALHDGELDTARSLLREHIERFPDGMLARERELALEPAPTTAMAASAADRSM